MILIRAVTECEDFSGNIFISKLNVTR